VNLSQLFFPSFDGHPEILAAARWAVYPSLGRSACVRRALKSELLSKGERRSSRGGAETRRLEKEHYLFSGIFSALPRLRVNFCFQVDEGPQLVGETLPAVFEEQKDQGEQQEQLPHRAEEEDVEVESLQNKDDQKSRSNERDETG